MVRYGKFVIGGLGWAFGGPLGALFGFFLGSMYDEMSKQEEQTRTQAGDFGLALIALTAGVIKADKKVKQSELDYVRKFLSQQFRQEQTQQLMELLDKTIDQSFSVKEICRQIRNHMEYEERLHLLHYLYGIANADGHVDSREDKIIQQMAKSLHIKSADLTSIRSMFVKDKKAPYKVLEIDPSASNDEVKKAYRKMAKKYHPDKVSHLGKEHTKTAEEKFQKVNEAYEQIKKERDMN